MSKNWKHIHVNNKLYFTYFLWFENHYMLLFCVTPSPIYSSQFICNLHHLRNLWCRFSKPPTSNFHCSDLHTMYYLLPISVHSSNHLLFLSQLLLEKSFSLAMSGGIIGLGPGPVFAKCIAVMQTDFSLSNSPSCHQ